MVESGSGPAAGLDDDLPEGLDDETREWIHKVDKMSDEDARKAMLEWRVDYEIKNAWSKRHEEFLKELP